MEDKKRNMYIDCMTKAIVKAGVQLRNGLGSGFSGVPFYAPGGHEITAASIEVESILDSEFKKWQIQNGIKTEDTLLNIPETANIQKVLSERFGDEILDKKNRDMTEPNRPIDKKIKKRIESIEFALSDCPDGSTKHSNFSKASLDGLPLSATPPTAINMTLYEGGTRFSNITAHLTYTLDGDLIIVRKNNNTLVDFFAYGKVYDVLPNNVHRQNPQASVLREIYKNNPGTICAAIMTNDNYGCMIVSENLRQDLKTYCPGISRIRFESTGSSILDQHISLYRNYSHLIIDLRGLYPEDGPVLDPAEVGAHYLAFQELGWDCKYRLLNDKGGNWDALAKFDILDEKYIIKNDESIKYRLAVAFYSPALQRLGNISRVIADSVNKGEQMVKESTNNAK